MTVPTQWLKEHLLELTARWEEAEKSDTMSDAAKLGLALEIIDVTEAIKAVIEGNTNEK